MSSEQQNERIRIGRSFLKANWEQFDSAQTDQNKGISMPPLSKPVPDGAEGIELPEYGLRETVPVTRAMMHRRSRRKFLDESISAEELSYLLSMTGRIQKELARGSFRPAPSGGARHAIETYLAIHRVDGFESALYRYLPDVHKLLVLPTPDDLRAASNSALHGQSWNSAVDFYWTAIPYRMEWRYTVVSHKIIALDAGHLCQNLYLACEEIGCGTCAIGAYFQEELDSLLGVDGEHEFAVYAAPVGKVEDTA